MIQRKAGYRPHTADIYRRSKTERNEIGEPIHTGGDPDKDDPAVSAVPCKYTEQSTEFVRGDSGERVNRPATVDFGADADIQEGDTLVISGPGAPSDPFEVRGIETQTDQRRGRVTQLIAEVERA